MARFQLLDSSYIPAIMPLVVELNKKDSFEVQQARLERMFTIGNYQCFGWFEGEELLGVSGGWITERLYSGKQLELDHVVVNPERRSKGIGGAFLAEIESWAKTHNCLTVELNTYVQNAASHKFYLDKGYQILGYHFQKKLASN